MSEWISIKDRLPDGEDLCLAYCSCLDVTTLARFDKFVKQFIKEDIYGYGDEIPADYWMPIPETPKT